MPPGTQPPASKTGWHLLTFLNGDTAVVRWNGTSWVWGSLTAPNSPIVGVTYLGATIADFAQNHPQRWTSAIAGLPDTVHTVLVSALDHGPLMLGQPFLVSAAGKPQQDRSFSEAVPVNAIPSPIDPNAGNSHLSVPSLSGLQGIAIRVLEAVGAVLLLVLGLHALLGGDNPVTVVGSKVRRAV